MSNESKRVSIFLGTDVINFYKEQASALEIPFSALMRLALRQYMQQSENNKDDKNLKSIDFDGQISLL